MDESNGSLKDRHALIVGGSGGIGAAVSVALAAAGCQVTVHGGHDSERLGRTAAAVRQAGTLRQAFLYPVAQAADAHAVLASSGSPDVLVVSFGPYVQKSFLETSPEEFERMVALNLLLPAVLIRQVLPDMLERRWGRILLFGGPRSDRLTGYREIAAYAAAKAGLASLVRSVALQCAGTGVSCNMVAPGYVETEYYSQSVVESLRRRIPGGNLVEPEEVARVAIGLMAGGSAATNGAIIPVDFGM